MVQQLLIIPNMEISLQQSTLNDKITYAQAKQDSTKKSLCISAPKVEPATSKMMQKETASIMASSKIMQAPY